RAFAPAERRGPGHRARSRAAAREADADCRTSGEHSGLPRDRDSVSGRPARSAVSDPLRETRRAVVERGRRRVTFRLLTYNIRRGGAGRAEPIARVIAACRPDVVLLQEATRPEAVAAIRERTGMADGRSLPGRSLGFLSRER